MLTERQRLKLAFKLILEASEKRKGQAGERIATEVLAVLNGESTVLQRVQEIHQAATAVRNEVVTKAGRGLQKSRARSQFRYHKGT